MANQWQHPYVLPERNTIPNSSIKTKESNDLDTMLTTVVVLEPGMWENDTGPQNWYAVEDETGIIAYFANGTDAYRFRLDQINGRLNPYAR